MPNAGGVSEVGRKDILEEVPPLGKEFAEELTPLQKVGYKLAKFVFLYIVGASVVIFIVSFFLIHLPAAPATPAFSGDVEQYTKQAEAYKSSLDAYQQVAKLQVERATQLFQLVVASTILPAFTAILGYIFGSKRSGD